jgi:hypothetical protein
MLRTLALAIALTVSLAPLASVWAQEPADELTPRSIADSTYAVRVAVDALAESMRRGQLDSRRFDDPQLAAAVGRLATAAGGRARRPPRADLGVLWDLQIDIFEFKPEGQDVLHVQAHVFLATAGDSASAPVTLTFQRRGDRWDLLAHEGFAARLVAMATDLGRRSPP